MELNLTVETFNPLIAELTELKNSATTVTEASPIEKVAEMRAVLVKKRREVETYGASVREESNKFSKWVIKKQNEVVGIIEPEELRLKQIEADVEKKAIVEARTKALPTRHEALSKIGDGIECADAQLLEMDDTAFMLYKAERITAWQEKEANRLAEAQRKLDEENARIAREEQIRQEAADRAKKDADERIRIAEQAKVDAERREKEAQERAERERIEAEERAKADEARLEKEKGYKQWLTDNSFDEATMKLINSDTEVRMYKLVATYKK